MSELLWKIQDVKLEGLSGLRLDRISLQIEKGVTAILGESGAGKSSFINLLTGFEKPSGGELEFLHVNQPDRLPLFWVPQDDGLWPQLTVMEHLKAVAFNRQESLGLMLNMLLQFGLSDLRDRKPEFLSQGERSRLSVVRALLSQAEVIVMDEPLAHVDYRSSLKYWECIQRYLEDYGSSLVFASHSSETVLRESEFCCCLEKGSVVYQGKTTDLYDNPPDERSAWFLGPINWIESDEAELWYGSRDCVKARPERLAVSPDESSGITLAESCFSGSHSKIKATHQQSGAQKTFYTQTDCRKIVHGKGIRFTILSVLMFLLLIAGCESDDVPELPVKEVDVWMLPEKGPSIPTPRSMTVSDDDELLILDDAGRVLVYDLQGKLLRKWDMPESDVGNPEGISVLPDKRVVVADTHYHRVVFFDLQGKVLGMFGKEGTGPKEFIYPVSVTHDDKGNYYVAEYGYNDRLQKFSPQNEFLLEMGSPGTEEGKFQRMSGMVWHEGYLYISDAINNRIQKFSDDGNFVEILDLSDYGTSLSYPYDITLAPDGGFFIVEYGAGRLTQLSKDGKLIGCFGKTGSGLENLTTPWGLASTKDGRVFVADTGNRRVMEIKF